MKFAIHFDGADEADSGIHFDPYRVYHAVYHATLDLVAFDVVELENFTNAFEGATTITFKVITHRQDSIWKDATLTVGLHRGVLKDRQKQAVVPYFSMKVSSEEVGLDKHDLYNFFKEIAGPWDAMADEKLSRLEPILIQTENQTRWEKQPPGQFSGYRPNLVGHNVFEKLCSILFHPGDVQVKMYTDPGEYGLDLCFRFNGIQRYCDWNTF